MRGCHRPQRPWHGDLASLGWMCRTAAPGKNLTQEKEPKEALITPPQPNAEKPRAGTLLPSPVGDSRAGDKAGLCCGGCGGDPLPSSPAAQPFQTALCLLHC